MSDPRPTLETPRDADEERRMRSAWVHGIQSLSGAISSQTYDPKMTWDEMYHAGAARLIRCKPDYVESEEPAPSGSRYRMCDRGPLLRMRLAAWLPSDEVPFIDATHIAALIAKMEEL